jgi:hypothetical protein
MAACVVVCDVATVDESEFLLYACKKHEQQRKIREMKWQKKTNPYGNEDEEQ